MRFAGAAEARPEARWPAPRDGAAEEGRPSLAPAPREEGRAAVEPTGRPRRTEAEEGADGCCFFDDEAPRVLETDREADDADRDRRPEASSPRRGRAGRPEDDEAALSLREAAGRVGFFRGSRPGAAERSDDAISGLALFPQHTAQRFGRGN